MEKDKTMRTFNVGDKVRVAPEATYGRNIKPVASAIQGKVVSVRTSHPDAEGDITVGLEGRADGWWVDPKYLTLVESEPKEYSFDPGGEKISFEDVKKGDTIAHLGEDSWNVGVADRFIDDAWWTKIGNMVTCGDVDYDRRLLHRPKPPLPTEPGTRINNVVLGDGERFPYAIHTFAPEGSGTRYEWVGFAFFGFTQDFDSNDITSWEPA